MPIYDVICPDGTVKEAWLGSADAALPPGCVKAPVQSFAVTGTRSLPDMSTQVKAGYYKMELQEGSRFRSRLTKNKIKKAWGW